MYLVLNLLLKFSSELQIQRDNVILFRQDQLKRITVAFHFLYLFFLLLICTNRRKYLPPLRQVAVVPNIQCEHLSSSTILEIEI